MRLGKRLGCVSWEDSLGLKMVRQLRLIRLLIIRVNSKGVADRLSNSHNQSYPLAGSFSIIWDFSLDRPRAVMNDDFTGSIILSESFGGADGNALIPSLVAHPLIFVTHLPLLIRFSRID